MLLKEVRDKNLEFSFCATNMNWSESIGALIPSLSKQFNDMPGADSYLGSIARAAGKWPA
jgi:hypothetical protein